MLTATSNVVMHSSSADNGYGINLIKTLHRAWERPYFSSLLDDLRQFFAEMSDVNVLTIYGLTVIVLQRSGMGKSQLASRFWGQGVPNDQFLSKEIVV
jgi:hypothetical protein